MAQPQQDKTKPVTLFNFHKKPKKRHPVYDVLAIMFAAGIIGTVVGHGTARTTIFVVVFFVCVMLYAVDGLVGKRKKTHDGT